MLPGLSQPCINPCCPRQRCFTPKIIPVKMGPEEPVTCPRSPDSSEVSASWILGGPVLGHSGSRNLARPLTASDQIIITLSSLVSILGIKNSGNVAFWAVSSDLPHYFVALSERKLIEYFESKRVMLMKITTTVMISVNVS